MTEQNASYVDKNHKLRYQRYLSKHRRRVNMQRIARKIIKKRDALTRDPKELTRISIKDTKLLMDAGAKYLKGVNDTLSDRPSVFHHLKLYFKRICQVANYIFPPTNFDTGIAILLDRQLPNPLPENPPKEEITLEVLNYFIKHRGFAQRLIACILQAGCAEIDELRKENWKDNDEDLSYIPGIDSDVEDYIPPL